VAPQLYGIMYGQQVLDFALMSFFFNLSSPSPLQISHPTPQNFKATLQLFFPLELVSIFFIPICFI